MSSSEWVSTSMPYLTPRATGQTDAWSAEAAARGGRGRQRIISADETAPVPVVAELLGVPEGRLVVVRRRMMYLDDQPCELTDTYYPAHIARGTALAGTAKIPGGAVTLLAELGYRGARAREDVVARMPNADERQALQLGLDQPVLHLTRLTLDEADRPLQVDMMTMPAHMQRLRYEIRIG
ncbi:UTRA domain-containing protein [Streptomyces sp. NPDC000410]|uniref:GntR family transcriptional regulator n=1 Tax=Streptomyces sp. NPDC000410 TaxID=3154254 RepID=UPI003326CB3D